MSLLSRLWPRSLWAQILLAAALALLVAQTVNLVILLNGRAQENQMQAAAMAMTRIAATIEELESTARPRPSEQDMPPPMPRQRVHPALRGIIPRLIPVHVSDTPLTPTLLDTESDIAEHGQTLFNQFGLPVTRVLVARVRLSDLPSVLSPRAPLERMRALQRRDRESHEAIFVSVTTERGQHVAAAVRLRPHDDVAIAWLLGQTLILYLAVLVPLAIIAFRIARPLKQLTQSAQQFAVSGAVSPVAADGPPDVQALITAFNQMQDRVGALLSEKDVMLGAIGHDLKTPLASLRLRVETLSIEGEEEEEREKIIATIGELTHMLDDILTFARLGQSGEAAEPVDLGALLSVLTDDYADAGRAVTMREPEGATTATVRPVLLRRALRNLIDNALAHGGVARLSLSRTPQQLAIHIDDDGPGIPMDQMARLFEPFQRAESSRNRATGGSGLGLTIARAIARAHGGDVALANRAEGGLTASLILPHQVG